MGAAEVGRELGDAGGPLLVGAVTVALNLNWGLAALALTLVFSAVLTARRPAHPYPPSAR